MVRQAHKATSARQKLGNQESNAVSVHIMTPDEAWAAFDERARQNLDMSGEAFIRAWQAGEIANPDRPAVMDVLMLMPVEW